MRRQAPRATARPGSAPAPVGGLNTVAGGYAMPEEDCPLLYNAIGAENGLRSRLGSREWCTGLAGIADNTVRSVLPFAGSSPAENRLFACTSQGIYDVSVSMDAPALVVAFPVQAGDAGWGTCHVVVNASGGHFLVYTDEVNGYYVYTEATATWIKVAQAASTPWAAATVYAAGARVSNGGLTYRTAAGLTSSAAPATGPAGTGAAIADGTGTWAYEPTVSGVDPANLVFAMVWKNRVWLVERDTATAWYLQIGFGAGGSLFGPATPFNFGAQFENGGHLVGLYSWTGDGGSGPDDRLVAVSSGGDVVIYQGTDPSAAGSFGQVGRWYLGGVPAGRRIGTRSGGDLLLMGTMGIIAASKLVVGKPLIDVSQYSTYKISNLFSRLASTYGGVNGWAMALHPEDNALLVTVPVAEGQATQQLAMSMVTRGWSPYRDLPIVSMGAWNRQLYFGTADGRVCVNTGYVDGVLLSDPDAFTPIDVSGITRFDNMGRGTQKQLMGIRPTIISEGGDVEQSIEARYGFDLTEATSPSTTEAPGDQAWDTAVWDVSLWGGAYAAQQKAGGAVGLGSAAAIAWRLSVTSRTVLIGFDFEYIESAGLT